MSPTTNGSAGPSNQVSVVLGAQWGDEGKGKLVDLLSEKAEGLGLFEMFVTQSWQKMFPLGDYEPTPDMSAAAVAKAM